MSHRFLPVAVCVLLLAAAPLRADDAEDQAVKAIEKLRGTVVHDDTNPARQIVKVEFHSSEVTDAGLRELAVLKGLKGLKTLNLIDCRSVTGAGLKELAALKELKELSLAGCEKVTDAGLKELIALKRLKGLNLSFTLVTDEGLKELADLKGLKELSIDRRTATVTNAGVADLQKALPDCKINRDY